MENNQKSYIDKEKCVGCGACIPECPASAIRMQTGWFSMVDEAICIGCGKCIELCHKHAPGWK